jgi:hypothetical protein
MIDRDEIRIGRLPMEKDEEVVLLDSGRRLAADWDQEESFAGTGSGLKT